MAPCLLYHTPGWHNSVVSKWCHIPHRLDIDLLPYLKLEVVHGKWWGLRGGWLFWYFSIIRCRERA